MINYCKIFGDVKVKALLTPSLCQNTSLQVCHNVFYYGPMKAYLLSDMITHL